MEIMIEVTKMNCDYVLQYLEKMEVPVVSKKNHDIVMCGLEKMIFLKEGIVKVSTMLEDGREYNITYTKGPDLLSLMCDTLREDVSYRTRIRVVSEEASFCLISREDFFRTARQDDKLKDYVEAYYRENLQRALYRQKCMTMNGKSGAVYSFLYNLIPLFGKECREGILIDVQVTNDDIAGFCGISTRNSVNRILRGLREENVIRTVDNKILILNAEYLKPYAD